MPGLCLLCSCSIGKTELDEFHKRRLQFEELPVEVKEVYSAEIKKESEEFDYTVVTTSDRHTFSHKHTGMDDGLWVLTTQGFNHHFYIDDKHFTLQANKGAPFVLHDQKLYYTNELNLAEYNYEKAEYLEVDLSKYIE